MNDYLDDFITNLSDLHTEKSNSVFLMIIMCLIAVWHNYQKTAFHCVAEKAKNTHTQFQKNLRNFNSRVHNCYYTNPNLVDSRWMNIRRTKKRQRAIYNIIVHIVFAALNVYKDHISKCIV